ncbi:MAG: tRNA (N6-threonylcarbamoyladenosine(37)-N6)-methyltransferase TrmO [Deltaproteobacteria bacterium]|nr:tRNA (N6-threonylcarbamoyladenosine(37)-N6)-methyltransferase TrmO [Deltaproteobacteria bacterium]
MARKSGWDIPDHDASGGGGGEGAPLAGGKVSFNTIGYINSPYQDPKEIPMQPVALNDTEGTIEIIDSCVEGLQGLEAFKHIYVFYHMHRAGRPFIKVKVPFQGEQGIFATRAVCRPSPLGFSIVELLRIEGNILHIRGVDMVDGEAVIDIKPYSADFDKVS